MARAPVDSTLASLLTLPESQDGFSLAGLGEPASLDGCG